MADFSNQRSVSRRQFLKGLGVGAAAVATPALWRPVRAQQAAVVGAGEHTYEVVPDWGQLPAGKAFGFTHGVVVDSQGRVFIHNQSHDAVAIFDPDGKFIKSWGPEFAGGAHGMQLRREAGTEFLYLSDYARHIVVKTTLDGEVIWTLKVPQEGGLYKNEGEYRPTNVAFAPNGDFYVGDGYGQSYIHQYNAKAEFIRSWGGAGTEPGKMHCPHGLLVDTRGDTPVLTVTDRENHRLALFTLDGQPQGFVTEEIRRPCYIDQRGQNLLIADLNGCLSILDKDNKPVLHLGDNPDVWKTPGWPNLPRDTWTPGKFISPHAACWDAAGNIYVVEWIKVGRVTKLRKV